MIVAADRLEPLKPEFFSTLENANARAEKVSRDLHCEVHVCEIIGSYKQTTIWVPVKAKEAM